MTQRWVPNGRLASFYRSCPSPWVRLHLLLRNLFCPLDTVAELLAGCTNIVDLGCGYGALAFRLRDEGTRRILGVDGRRKLSLAVAGRQSTGVRFLASDLREVNPFPVDGVVLLDVLYLIPESDRYRLVTGWARALIPGGVFILSTIDTRGGWKYTLARLQEWLAVRVVRITEGSVIEFPDPKAWARILEQEGLRIQMRRMDRGGYIPQVFLIARKPS